ncbi:hypothetical protein GCM10007971_37010 [Oceanobacillus indicireducens]|uniref:Com family DNA-binding transcriptional regulator n=1 Tax=Oceanobacillus indicireducens TaxID=1004261 RepID=A0A917Y3N5_9BACI|nr:hypothetical protein GCM10007971_37010 [Oceanobacillus indicireducens]
MTNKPVRCRKCNKLMFYISDDLKGKIEVKCTRCGSLETISK